MYTTAVHDVTEVKPTVEDESKLIRNKSGI